MMRAIIFLACFVLVYATIDKKQNAPNTITEGKSLTLVVPENEPINLSCSFEANPEVTYEWKKNNTLQKGNDLEIEGHVLMNFPIEHVTQTDTGTYQCIAVGPDNQNRIGYTNLNFVAVPDITISAGDVKKPEGNVLLSWRNANKNDHSENYIIEYALDNGTKFYSEKIPNNRSEYETEWLESNIGYRFRIWALNGTNQMRVSPYSAEVHNTEKNEPEFILTVSIANTTKTSITYKWKGPPKELLNKVNNYRINASNGETHTISPGAANGDVNYTLTNLNCSTEYSIEVRACAGDRDECTNSSEIRGWTLYCTNNSAAHFYSQINTILMIVFVLHLSTYA